MKKLLLAILLIALTNAAFATPPDSTMLYSELVWPTEIKFEPQNQDITSGATFIVAGVLLAGIGVVKEIAREPYPTHPTNINPNPDAPAVLNYLLIGSGIATAGYGFRIILKF